MKHRYPALVLALALLLGLTITVKAQDQAEPVPARLQAIAAQLQAIAKEWGDLDRLKAAATAGADMLERNNELAERDEAALKAEAAVLDNLENTPTRKIEESYRRLAKRFRESIAERKASTAKMAAVVSKPKPSTAKPTTPPAEDFEDGMGK